MSTTYNQLIIGSGFSGLCMGIKLRQEGENNFIILERNDWLGGTWYVNHYPGAACDVESHLYCYSFEPNPNWSREFGPQEEILHYMEHCVKKYDLKEHLHFNTNVISAVFDEKKGIWNVETESGKNYSAKVVVSCSGGLSQPSFPAIKGLETFKGKTMHSALWDNDYDLKDKTVAVIGTGASAIQIVPAIAPMVKQLNLFQRTPPWILPKLDKEIPWLRRWFYKHIPITQRLHRLLLYWLHEMQVIGFMNPGILKFFSNFALFYLKKSVKDKTLRQKLTPNYVMGCKRILLTNDYFPAAQRKNVEVITEGIQEINKTGVATNDGKQHDVDAIILATGFKVAEDVNRFETIGRGRMDLNEAWRDGAEAYLGTSVSGFPNMFFVMGPNTGLGHNSMILMIESQVNYIMGAIKMMKHKKAKSIEVKSGVQEEFNNKIQKKLSKTVWQSGGCSSWYQTKSGKNVTLWPGFTFTFMKWTKKFDEKKYDIVYEHESRNFSKSKNERQATKLAVTNDN